MFDVGDFVFYSSGGICQIDAIVPCPFKELNSAESYYLMHSLKGDRCELYVPTKLCGVSVRPIMAADKARELLDGASSISVFHEENAKRLRERYNDAIRSNSPDEWLAIIRTAYERIHNKQKPIKISDTERGIYESAKRYLYTELSLCLDISTEDIEKSILKNLIT